MARSTEQESILTEVNKNAAYREESTPDYPGLDLRDYHFVFVYGTLRKGFHNNCYMRNAIFLGRAYSAGKYHMFYSWGKSGFPVVVNYDLKGLPREYITGEVYAVDKDTIADCDMLEANGSMYERKLLPFHLKDQKPFNSLEKVGNEWVTVEKPQTRACWVYLGINDFWGEDIPPDASCSVFEGTGGRYLTWEQR